MKDIIVTIPDAKFEFFMELFQSLGIKTSSDTKFPSMTDQQIIDQAILADKQIKQGKTTPHDQVYQDFKKW